jgi:sulfate adenylyltransferase
MPKPHGGRLVNRVLPQTEREAALRRVPTLPHIEIDLEMAKEVRNIAHGVFSPLEGFLCREDYVSVVRSGRLASGLPWTIPIVLDVGPEARRGLEVGQDVALYNQGRPIAILHLNEIYTWEREETAMGVFDTTDRQHPGVARLESMGEFLLGGSIHLVNEPQLAFEQYYLRPEETRFLFQHKGWRTVVGFQTRNVPHLGHEYVQKTALTFVDGLFINPVIGKKKEGDFADEVILETYQVLMDNYYPSDRVVMSILPLEMRYAGPREAIFHAIVRKNFGCSHFIVGRDHAGVGSYYAPYAAQEIFDDFPDLEITPLFFGAFFHCRRCGGVANDKTCPHGEADRLQFSGTRLRDMLLKGEAPPPELVRPEVARVFSKKYAFGRVKEG